MAEKAYGEELGLHKHKDYSSAYRGSVKLNNDTKPQFLNRFSYVGEDGKKTEPLTVEEFSKRTEEKKAETLVAATETQDVKAVNEFKKPVSVDIIYEEENENLPVILIGEAFSTYIVAQMGDSIFMIDKHAAHERIIFNDLRKNHKVEIQQLLTSVAAVLSAEEYDAIISNLDLMLGAGFEVEDLGNSTVAV